MAGKPLTLELRQIFYVMSTTWPPSLKYHYKMELPKPEKCEWVTHGLWLNAFQLVKKPMKPNSPSNRRNNNDEEMMVSTFQHILTRHEYNVSEQYETPPEDTSKTLLRYVPSLSGKPHDQVLKDMFEKHAKVFIHHHKELQLDESVKIVTSNKYFQRLASLCETYRIDDWLKDLELGTNITGEEIMKPIYDKFQAYPVLHHLTHVESGLKYLDQIYLRFDQNFQPKSPADFEVETLMKIKLVYEPCIKDAPVKDRKEDASQRSKYII